MPLLAPVSLAAAKSSRDEPLKNIAITYPAGTVTSITAGQSFELMITGKDIYGNKAVGTPSVSGAVSAPVLTPVPSVAANCSSLDDAIMVTAVMRCTMVTAGSYSVVLSLVSSGEAISGSPIPVSVSPGSVSGANSLVSGDGITGGSAGDILGITLQTLDSYGTPATSGGASIGVVLSSSGGSTLTHTTPAITDHGNGTYTVLYSVEQLPTDGSGQLALSVNGDPVSGGPWSPAWSPGPANASNSIVSLDAPGQITAGVLTRVATAQLFDDYGNSVTGSAGLSLLTGGMNPGTATIQDALNPVVAPAFESFSFLEDGNTFSVFTVAEVSMNPRKFYCSKPKQASLSSCIVSQSFCLASSVVALPSQVASVYDGDVFLNGNTIVSGSLLNNLTVRSQDENSDHHDHWSCLVSAAAADGILEAGETATLTVSQLDSYGNRIWAGGSAATATAAVRLSTAASGNQSGLHDFLDALCSSYR